MFSVIFHLAFFEYDIFNFPYYTKFRNGIHNNIRNKIYQIAQRKYI